MYNRENEVLEKAGLVGCLKGNLKQFSRWVSVSNLNDGIRMFKKKKNKLKNIFLELLTLVSQNKISKVQEKKNVNDNIASYFSELDFSCITDLLQ